MIESDEAGTSQQPLSPEEPLSFLKQVFLIFTDSGRALAELVARPRWLGAFAVVLLFSVASVQATYPLIMEARRDAIQQSQQVSGEQADVYLERLSRPLTPAVRVMMVFFQVIGQAIGLVVIAGVLMFGGNILLGGESNFVTLLAITAHSWLVLIPKVILTVPLMLAKGSVAVSTSLQVLLSGDQWTTPLGVVLGAVDVFSIWMIVLLVMGISAAYHFSRAKSIALVVSLYVIMILIGMASSALLSGLMQG